MNEQQRLAYENPMALAGGALPPKFIRSARVGRFGYFVGLSLNK
jgi:hypothetical protein